jgi:tripartite-type tricarboxylate transporter receptor subunit TctC
MNLGAKRIKARLIALALLCCSNHVMADDYPSKTIKMIVPASPGGGADFLARAIGTKLTEITGQSIVIDNRAGASGTIAADMVAKAPRDGYTILMGQSTSIVIAPQLMQKLPYDTIKDLKPVTLVAEVPNLLVINPNVPAKTVKELIDLAKAKPEYLNFGSSGNGAPSHLAGEMFNASTGVKMTHVPYKGAGPAVNGVVAGEIQVMFAPIVSVMPHVKSGRLRALAVTSSTRSSAAPELPTLIESGLVGYEINSWFGLFVPSKTPNAIVDKLYLDTNKALKSPDIRERFAREGAEPVGSTPAEFAKFVNREYAKYTKIIKDQNIQPN